MAPQAFQAAIKIPAARPEETTGGIQKHSGKGRGKWSRHTWWRPLRIRTRLHRCRIPPPGPAGLFPAPHRLRTRRRSVRF